MKRGIDTTGHEALEAKGWLGAHRWLLLRRTSQLCVLALFLVGPWFGWWLVKGNLSYSLTLGTVPLTDPLVLLQSLLTGHVPERNAIMGVVIVLLFYALVGGRVFCAWVCPVNVVTDAASALRRKLDIRGGGEMPRQTRYWILALILVLAATTGSIVWELFVMKRGWCGHLCPVGAFYGLLGKWSVVRLSASKRDACNNCLDCFAVCPEQQVIRMPLKGAAKGVSPIILSSDCSNCGRCIDVCSKDVFTFGTRFTSPVSTLSGTDPKSPI
jgi:ferredoxin-type protein NapH